MSTPLLTAIFNGGHCPERLHDFEACARILLDHPDFDLKINDAPLGPTWVCVLPYPENDYLLPLLKLFLARGFDPNATHGGIPPRAYPPCTWQCGTITWNLPWFWLVLEPTFTPSVLGQIVVGRGRGGQSSC